MDPSPPQPSPARGARSEEQVRRAHRLESLGRLAGGVAHDFNNVLGVILGYVELAKMNMEGADPKALRHLDQALSTLERARVLSDRLLDFAREEPRPADVCDLNETVQAVRELLAETLDRKIHLETRLAGDLPPVPLGPDEMHQAVANLCLNAAQALPGGGTIAVETFARRVAPTRADGLRAGRYACVCVRDTGPGIPGDLRERIFDPYFTTHPDDRSGLGLWVVRGLVERYGGRVAVDGDERGAAFTLWLPSELDVVAEDAGPAVAPADDVDDVEDVDVLIVDDEPGVRDVTRAYLERDGYRVLTAETGAEAEDLLGRRPGAVRVVFLDHRLPDAKGADLAWKIHQMERPPRIVITTGLTGVAETSGLPAGARVLAKPFLHGDLKALLRGDLGVLPRGPAPAG